MHEGEESSIITSGKEDFLIQYLVTQADRCFIDNKKDGFDAHSMIYYDRSTSTSIRFALVLVTRLYYELVNDWLLKQRTM